MALNPTPRLKVAYLLSVAVAAFALKPPRVVAALAALQLALWFGARLPLRPLLRMLRKLALFLTVLVLSLGFSGLEAAGGERWIALPFGLRLSESALAVGGVMALRILTVVMASALVQRTGEGGAVARGLRGVGVPSLVALTIDATLASLNPEGEARPEGKRGSGRGTGIGGGRHRHRDEAGRGMGGNGDAAGAAEESPRGVAAWLASARRLRHAEGLTLIGPVRRQLVEARREVAEKHPGLSPSLEHDVPILASIGTVMLGVKAVKVLPGLPFAPGFKGAVLLPFYILARDLARSRAAGTALGSAFGIVSFFFGDGKFGLLEVVKHTAPGTVIDLTYPLLRPALRSSTLACCLYGTVLGATRLSGELAVAWLVGAPHIFYAFLGLAALTHLGAGFVSGFVTSALLRSADQVREDPSARPAPANDGRASELVVGDGRTHLGTPLMAESLLDRSLIAATQSEREIPMVPYATVVGLGGRSVLDRGRAAVFPLVDEIVANKRHKMIVAVSGGARMRHVYQIALDLGVPTGGLAMLAGGSEEQYAVMLQALLARHGGAAMPRDHFGDLPLWLQSGIIPIVISMPPYHYWEPPSARGRLPHNGSDLGVYMTAEALGVKAMIFVKDRDGLYTDDPETNPQAELIPRIGARCLLARELPSLIIDRAVVETLRNARFIKRVQIINGLRPGNLTRALEGEPVGTIIEKD